MTNNYRLVREPERRSITAIPTSTWYDLQKKGLVPPPVKLGCHAVAWPESELVALNRARIAGRSDSEIKSLVAKLAAAREHALNDDTAEAE